MATELEIAVEEVKRLSAALEATCRREEAERKVVMAALAWKKADDDFGYRDGPTPVSLGVVDGLGVAVQIFNDEYLTSHLETAKQMGGLLVPVAGRDDG